MVSSGLPFSLSRYDYPRWDIIQTIRLTNFLPKHPMGILLVDLFSPLPHFGAPLQYTFMNLFLSNTFASFGNSFFQTLRVELPPTPVIQGFQFFS